MKKMFFLFLFYNKFMLDIKSRSADENNALIIQVRKITMLDFSKNLQSNLNLPFAVKLHFFLMCFVLVGSPQYAVVLLRLLSTKRQNTVILVINLK